MLSVDSKAMCEYNERKIVFDFMFQFHTKKKKIIFTTTHMMTVCFNLLSVVLTSREINI